jgi:predicted nucleotidyltransferase
MQTIVTLSERKAAEAARRQDAVASLVPVLTAYARAHGGRFLLFGSAARGRMRYDSDVDLLLDFSEEALGAAWNFAETACWDRGLEPDLMPYGWCKPAFLAHVAADLRVLA